MSKVILLKDYDGLDEIKFYMLSNENLNYYITPTLMYELLGDMRYRCVVGVSMEGVKVKEHNKIHLMTISVYNRVFEQHLFKVEAIKDGCLKKINHNIYNDSVVFGLEKDRRNFTYFVLKD